MNRVKLLGRSISFCLFLMVLCSKPVFSQQADKVVVPFNNAIGKGTLATNASVTTLLDKIDDSNAPTSLSWNDANESVMSIAESKAIATLKIDPSEGADATKNYDLTFTIAYVAFDRNLTKSTGNITLRVQNDPTCGKAFQDQDAHIFHDAVYLKLTVSSIYNNLSSSVTTMVPRNLVLANSIEAQRYYDFNPSTGTCGSSTWANIIIYRASKDAFDISWPSTCTIVGQTEWEVEWTHVDNYKMVESNGIWTKSGEITADDLDLDFRGNATRVRLKMNQPTYRISNVFEEGYLVVRMRAIGRTGSKFDRYAYGNWFPSQYSTVDAHADSMRKKITSSLAHEGDDKTWQYVATYAEQGKNKEVISYHDGLNKNRQAVTKLSTSGSIVVGETIYDHEGRPAIQVLPTPADSLQDELKYYPGFNKRYAMEAYTADDFDGKDYAIPMSSKSGASQYYSDSNLTNTIHRDYLPDAKGYPFTQTIYARDQTGRIEKQSGVGYDHRIGSGHETEYLYAKPSQTMLNKLFGSEVGWQQHYKKNMVIDPNGQMSVSYVDQHGRVVATSLDGESPGNLNKLNSQADLTQADSITERLDTLNNKLKSLPRPTILELNYPYISTADGYHKFWYEFQPEEYVVGCKDICFDCVYELAITIRGKNDSVFYDTLLDVGPIDTLNANCSPQSKLTLFPGSSITTGGLKLHLPRGKYSITKTLTIDTDVADDYWTIYQDSSDCFLPLDTFVARALVLQQDCDSVTIALPDTLSASCLGLYEVMVNDMRPGRQYGLLYEATTPGSCDENPYDLSVFNATEENDLSSYWNDFGGEDALWSNPCSPYRDIDGSLSLIYDSLHGARVKPENASSLGLFLRNWNDNWAHSLVCYHPEYAYFDLCQTMENSHKFDDSLVTATYSEAVVNGWLDSDDKNAILDFDPFYQKDTGDFNTTPFNISFDNGLPKEFDDGKKRLKNVISKAHSHGYQPSLKQLAATMACYKINYPDTNCWQGQSDNFGESQLPEKHLDLQWDMYRALYLARKKEEYDKFAYVFADSHTTDAAYHIRFARQSFAYQDHTIASCRYHDIQARYHFSDVEYGFDLFESLKEGSVKTSAETKVTAYQDTVCNNQCSAYISMWRQQLETCVMKPWEEESIIKGFLQVCKASCDQENIFGLSGVLSTATDSGYVSFDDVLKTVLGTQGGSNNYCNHLLIGMPLTEGHNVMPGRGGTMKKDCGCNVLAEEFKRYEERYIPDSECSDWATRPEGKAVERYLNKLDSLNKLSNSSGTWFNSSSASDYAPFANHLKARMPDNTATAWETETKLVGNHLHISIRELNNDANKASIVLYDWNWRIGSFPSSVTFSDIEPAPIKVSYLAEPISGFKVKVSYGSTVKWLKGSSARFPVYAERTCLKYNISKDVVMERVYADMAEGFDISYAEFRALANDCSGGGYIFKALELDQGKCDPLRSGVNWRAAGQMLELIKEMAIHQAPDKKFDTGDHYNDNCNTGPYTWLPDHFSSYNADLKEISGRFHNWKFDTTTNTCNRDFILWGGWIGVGCVDTPNSDECYISLSAFDVNDKEAISDWGGLNSIDSITGYHYSSIKGHYFVKAWKDGEDVPLYFDNCLMTCCEAPTPDPCYTLESVTMKRNGQRLKAKCTKCQTYALEDFLDDLAPTNQLTETTAFNITTKDGYAASHPQTLRLPGISHEYKALSDPDNANPQEHKLTAHFGNLSGTYTILNLSKPNTAQKFLDIDSITDLCIDTNKLAEYLLNSNTRDLYGATFHFVARAWYDSNGVATWMKVFGSTNRYSLGTCYSEELLGTRIPYASTFTKTCATCVECVDLEDGLRDYQTDWPDMAQGHPLYFTSLTNYLNAKFNTNHTFTEWDEFMTTCHVADRVLGKKLKCAYEMTVTSGKVAQAKDSVWAMQKRYEALSGTTFTFTRDSLTNEKNTYCFNFNHLHGKWLRKAIDELEDLATTLSVGGSDKASDVLQSDTMVVWFYANTINANCRGALRTLLTNSYISTQYSNLDIDSTTVYQYDDDKLDPVEYRRYTVDLTGVPRLKHRWLKSKIDSTLDNCAYSYATDLWPGGPEWVLHKNDTICSSADTTSGSTCTDCESIRNEVLDFHRNLVPNPSVYETLLEAKLAKELNQEFEVFRKPDPCEECNGYVTYVCDSLNPAAIDLDSLLSDLVGADYFKNPGTGNLDNNTNIVGTALYNNQATGHNLTFSTKRSGNDTVIVVLKDTMGYYQSVGLYAQDPANTDLCNITHFRNIRLLPDNRGSNRWFKIDGYDSDSSTYRTIFGYISHMNLSNCCLFDDLAACYKPLFREETIEDTDCDTLRYRAALRIGAVNHFRYMESEKARFVEAYRAKCQEGFDSELFQARYPNLQHHYTLYYYDQAGNLVRTVPPRGVELLTDGEIQTVDNDRQSKYGGAQVRTAHKFSTYYKYNSLNQVQWQKTPDGGESQFFYDRLGRLVFSQNAEQAVESTVYSYTKYDAIGRIREVGEVDLSGPLDEASLLSDTSYANTQCSLGTRSQITRTYYDEPLSSAIDNLFKGGQTYLRNRVASVTYTEVAGTAYNYATHYSYDVHGNVKTLIQDFPELEELDNDYGSTGHRYKTVDYFYDLVSGNVNEVHYQAGEPDQFYHRYSYDADNRIISAETSRDYAIWDEDAHYNYYLHGPLARAELGAQKVQGLDYAYTIHGWLKGVNSETLDVGRDLNEDGKLGSSGQHIARDAFGFSLGYYNGDYTSIESTDFLASRSTNGLGGTGEGLDLYNGNIGHMVSANRAMLNKGKGVLGMNYKYDQLNRLASSESFVLNNTASNSWNNVNKANIYSTNYQYDPNGNITDLTRYGFRDADTLMDSLMYNYYPHTNRLKSVSDHAGNDNLFSEALGGVEDLNSGQDTTGNYVYDPIGNLIQDKQEAIKTIDWNVYGKVTQVEREDTSKAADLCFKYDASGNRVVKIVKPTPAAATWKYTYYLRDAQGNVLATYQKCNGLADTSFNDSLITKWIRDTLGSDTLAPFTQYTFGNDPVFISLLIDELTTNGNDTNVIRKYTVSQILGWDETLAQDLLEAYANTAADYDEIINELVDHERSKLVDALITHDANSFIDAVLTEDASNDFLDCYTTQEVDDLWNALITPPTSSATKADRIADLMTSADRTNLITEMLDAPSGMYAETVDHLKTCVAASELKDALHDPSFTTRALMLEALASGIGATTLTTFFTTGKDPKPWRPAKLLHKHGNATYILNVLASNATDFVYEAIRLDHTVVDDVLKGHETFSTVEYINAVSKYFGKDVARRVFNALLSNFEYTREFLAQEYNIYGSSRVGVKKDTSVLLYQKFKDPVVDDNGDFDLTSATTLKERKAVLDTVHTSRILAFKQYELSNHLGNVLATVLDRRCINTTDTSVIGSDTTFTALWDADITTAQGYYPFGMLLPNRVYSADSTGTGDYRYAFNGMERDDDWNGDGNSYDFGARIYDARIGRWLAVDALEAKHPYHSPYLFTAANPILYIDPDGNEFDLSNLDPEQRKSYDAMIEKLKGSEIFAQMYKEMDESKTIFIINHTDEKGGGTAILEESVNVRLNTNLAQATAQELFHGYQGLYGASVYEDKMTGDYEGANLADIEVEGEVATYFILKQIGIVYSTGPGQFLFEIVDGKPVFTRSPIFEDPKSPVPSSNELKDDKFLNDYQEYKEMFREANLKEEERQQQIDPDFEMPSSYTQKSTDHDPTTLTNLVEKSEKKE